MLLFLVYAYCIVYWKKNSPPTGDVISPLITLYLLMRFLCLSTIKNNIYISVCITLTLDLIADFLMDVNNLYTPILLFSLSHIFRQYLYYSRYSLTYYTHIIFTISITLFIIQQYMYIKRINNKLLFIGLYIILLIFTYINISLSKHEFDYSFLPFVLSDCLIGAELLFGKIYPRQIRILIVPLLYWISQYNMYKENL